MIVKRISTAALALAAASLAACQTNTGAGADTSATAGFCRADAAEALAGKDLLTDAQAMELTGATMVRQIAPGQPVTMDYRQERVTIETDPATGKIVRAFCG